MSVETAHVVIAAVASVGALVWLFGLRVFLKTLSAPAAVAQSATIPGATVPQARKSVLQVALAGQQNIVEKSEETVVVEPVFRGANAASSLPCRITITFKEVYGGVALNCVTDFTRLNRTYAIITGAIVGLGLVALVVLPVLLWIYVAPSDKASVRAQAFQTFQVGHLLWPVFLVNFARKRTTYTAQVTASNLLAAAEIAD